MSTEDNDEEEATIILGSAPGSPEHKVKFLCSHGGKILPRPADSHLKYVGGETRVISVPRDINFPELMKKLTNLFDHDMILKYQLVPEDLDVLVSVKSNEDVRHMLEEYDRHKNQGTPRLRAFLFPASPIVINNQTGATEHQALEQRYIDAINGIVHATKSHLKPLSINLNYQPYNISSTCSSPRSPESCTTTDIGIPNGRTHMNRVHSSPSLSDLDSQHNHSNHQTQPHHHHHHQNYRQPTQHQHQHHKPPLRSEPEQLNKYRSVGQAEHFRYHPDHVPHYYYTTPRQSRGSVCYKCMHFDDYGPLMERRIIRAESLPVSPSLSPSLPRSPRHGCYGADV